MGVTCQSFAVQPKQMSWPALLSKDHQQSSQAPALCQVRGPTFMPISQLLDACTIQPSRRLTFQWRGRGHLLQLVPVTTGAGADHKGLLYLGHRVQQLIQLNA